MANTVQEDFGHSQKGQQKTAQPHKQQKGSKRDSVQSTIQHPQNTVKTSQTPIDKQLTKADVDLVVD